MGKKLFWGMCVLVFLGAGILLRAQESAPYRRSAVAYRVPDVRLLNQRGEEVPLRSFLDSERPVLLEFTFTSCTTICPGQAVLFSNFQRRLGAGEEVRLVSISVDPEVDTPAVLQDYLEHYQARPGWDFLTGTREDIQQVMAAFGYRPTDMVSHDSVMLLRSPRSGEWFRIDGELDPASLLQEYRRLLL